jgi:hypothetical protein
MKTTTPIYVALVVALLALSAFGQKSDRPDLSGSWTLDAKRSQSVESKLSKGTLGKSNRTTSRLQIDHQDPLLKLTEVTILEAFDSNGTVIKTSEFPPVTTVYYTDGRGETNHSFGATKWSSTTKWKGNRIAVHRAEPSLSTMYTTIEFWLSKDGKELKIITETVMMPSGSLVGQSWRIIESMSGKKIYVRN